MDPNKRGASGTTNRRQVLGAAITIGAVVALGSEGGKSVLAQQDKRANAPNWTFAIHNIEDPYIGMLDQKVSQNELASEGTPTAASVQVVAFEIEIDNASSQPLNFRPSDVRLRLATGVEYRGDSIIGSEPRIGSRLLNSGERSRGWVWFEFPADAEPIELVYIAPSPELRVPL